MIERDNIWMGLEGVPNARQLGGIVTADGRRVKQGLLFRSAILTGATDADLHRLRNDLGIGYVIDLRTLYEVSHWPDQPVPGCQYVNMPISDDDNNIWLTMARCDGADDEERLINFAFTEQAKSMTRHIYVGYMDDEFCQLQYAAFLDKLLHAPDGAVLWHCSQGKDRTGLVSAFLLFALGCDRQTVVEEFDLTNEAYQLDVDRVCRRLRQMGGTPEDESVVTTLLGVKTSYFEDALDHVDSNYGSMERYLHEVLVLTDQEIIALKNKYLE